MTGICCCLTGDVLLFLPPCDRLIPNFSYNFPITLMAFPLEKS